MRSASNQNVVAHKNPNPQGKGLSSVLNSLQQAAKGLRVPAKDVYRIADELFTSLFVLNSQVKFKPIVGKTYWLYQKDRQYRLSLIAPEQWSSDQYGYYIGSCELQTDLSWTLELSEYSLNDQAFIAHIQRLRERFNQKLQHADRIDDILPVYMETLPFYCRVLASALACSLKQSMHKAGISGLTYKQAETQFKISDHRKGHVATDINPPVD